MTAEELWYFTEEGRGYREAHTAIDTVNRNYDFNARYTQIIYYPLRRNPQSG